MPGRTIAGDVIIAGIGGPEIIDELADANLPAKLRNYLASKT